MNNHNILDQKISKIFNRGIARTLNALAELPEDYKDIIKKQLWVLKDDVLDYLVSRSKSELKLLKLFNESVYNILEIFDHLDQEDKTKIKRRIWLLKEDVYIALGR